jgi:hypothetical protein
MWKMLTKFFSMDNTFCNNPNQKELAYFKNQIDTMGGNIDTQNIGTTFKIYIRWLKKTDGHRQWWNLSNYRY